MIITTTTNLDVDISYKCFQKKPEPAEVERELECIRQKRRRFYRHPRSAYHHLV